jgi:hypothetical protein
VNRPTVAPTIAGRRKLTRNVCTNTERTDRPDVPDRVPAPVKAQANGSTGPFEPNLGVRLWNSRNLTPLWH